MKSRYLPWIFIAPALALFGMLVVYPTGYGINLSLHYWDGLSDYMDFVGLENYARLFTDSDLHWASLNTAIFVVMTAFVQSLLALFLALAIESVKSSRMRNFYRVVFILPALISAAITGLIWSYIYNPNFGLLNDLLNTNISWLGNDNLALWSIIFANFWQWTGWNAMIFCAGIQSLPAETLEAARMDGAKGFNYLYHMVIPLLRYTIIVVVVPSFINGWKVFELIYVMMNNAPTERTHSIATYLYGQITTDIGYATAIGYGLTIFVFIMVMFYIAGNKDLRKG